MSLGIEKQSDFGISWRYRLARAVSTVLVLSLIQIVAAPLLVPTLAPQAQAANLYDNRSNFQQWTTWQGVAANHVPYKTSSGTAEITSNSDAINLTQDVGSQTGFLWNTQALSYTQDLSVSANIYLGAKDGADGVMFSMRPLNQWPNGGTAGASTGSWAHWGTGEIRAIFDTYQNDGERAEDHLRVEAVTTGSVGTKYTGTGVLLKNGSGVEITDVENNQLYPFTFRWTAATRTFSVFSGLAANYPIFSTVITNAQLDATQFAWGWMGFTGGASNYQAIYDVTYHVGPTVSSSDTDSTVADGSSVTLSASYTSSEASPTRRWEYSTDGGSTWTSTGSSDATYTFTASRSLTQRKYRFYVESTAVGITYSKSTTPITLTVSPPILNSETDTALSLNAANQYAKIDGTIMPTASGSPFTVEAWIYPNDAGTNDVIFSQGTSSTRFYVKRASGNLIYYRDGFNTTTGEITCGGVLANTWTHIAITWNGSNETNCYINANKVRTSTSALSSIKTLNGPTFIGQYSADPTVPASTAFAGQIDELKIWSSVRDQSQILSSSNSRSDISDANLLAYYDFNEGSGANIYNRKSNSSSASDFVIQNNAAWASDSITETSISGPYTIQQFFRSYITVNNGWKVPTGVSRVRTLVVAGGGGGGNDEGGGGGGGGFLDTTSVSVTSGTFVTVTIGQGGVGANGNDDYHAANGQDSTFHTLVAIGGGGGGSAINTNNGLIRNGRAGGSGGGGAGETLSNKSGGSGTMGQGFDGGMGSGSSTVSGRGGGGGGASEAGNTGLAGKGGNGKASDISGTSVIYAGGGGGGNGNTATTSYAGGDGGGGRGGSTTITAVNGTPNSGGGGGGAGDGITPTSSVNFSGADGGSGIVIIRWITATAPIFTGPASDTLTAGMVETFTVTGTPISPLTRGYRWQVSSDTGTTWVNATTGTGFTSASYTTPILETTTSGIRYQYRVVVTDSDTAGLFIVETSTAIVFLTINPRITITGSSVSLSQKYGETQTVTYTIANGTGTRTTVASPNNRTGITWSSVSGDSATIGIGPGLGFGTYYETLTVTDSVTATTTQMITISISKADTITVTNSLVTMTYSGAQANSSYTITGLKNSETATVTVTYNGASPTVLAPTSTAPSNAGTYYATPSAITLSAGGSTNNYQNVIYESATVTINKANQAPLTIGQYDAFPGISNYPLNVYGGTGLGTVTRTLVSSGTANCTLTNSMFLTAVNQGTCSVRAVKSGGINYFDETTTATIYWIQFQTNYSNGAAGGATGITLTGETAIEKRTYETFTVLSFANGSGSVITSASIGSVLRIVGTGFNASDSTTEVFLGMTSVGYASLTFNVSDPMANYIQFVVPADAETDQVVMRSSKGWATSPGILTITPIVNM